MTNSSPVPSVGLKGKQCTCLFYQL